MSRGEWFVDISRIPFHDSLFGVYIGKKYPFNKGVDVVEPMEVIMRTVDRGHEIEPAIKFQIFDADDIQNLCKKFIDAIIRAFPDMKEYLREKFAVKVNADEMKAKEEHIKNLNEILDTVIKLSSLHEDVRMKK